MKGGVTFRGQPLLLLGGLLAGWLGLRVTLWQPPLASSFDAGPLATAGSVPNRLHAPDRFATSTVATGAYPAGDGDLGHVRSLPPLLVRFTRPTPLANLEAGEAPQPKVTASIVQGMQVQTVLGRNLSLAAGTGDMGGSPSLHALVQQPPPAIPAVAPRPAGSPDAKTPRRGPRWSGDVWLLMRDDSITPIQAGLPGYGRSQAGAVLRYSLSATSERRPQAYLRASTALAGPHQQELAAGVSARVLPKVPVRFAAETRVADAGAGARFRPAAYAVTELPPIELPLAARAEIYAQAGYVGGKYATAFIDGQARFERTLTRRGDTSVNAGAGAWGGAQEGAARFDIGPAVSMTFRIGDVRGRLAADYRFRVAGDAEPKSGPALTLSAGF